EYADWNAAGRPIEPAQTIREMVEKMRAAFPRASFSWYSDDAHYQADFPQDHTPYSFDGWPVANPYPRVCATDIMHRPDLGVDCDELLPYWLAEARAGNTPWRKYMIYKATIYDVRFGWRAQESSGHHEHIHLSDRTDWVDRSIGSWSPVPGDEDMDAKTFLALLRDPAVSAYLRALPLQYPVARDKSLLALYREMAAKVDLIASKVDIDPEELAAIEVAASEGARTGVLASADALADAVAAKLPGQDLTAVKAALREIFAEAAARGEGASDEQGTAAAAATSDGHR
ncbi:MAG TPA: hypothetical protein VF163_13630, partial [Micromonosporaceae bacterium]